MIKYPKETLDVVGYADWVENGHKSVEDTELGMARAFAVKLYLASKGIAKNRLLIKSFGSDALIPQDMTENSQASLRRVEVVPHYP